MNNKTVQGLGKNDKGSVYVSSLSSSNIRSTTINTDKLFVKGVEISGSSQTGSTIAPGSINNTIIGNVTSAFGRFTNIDVINNTASTSSSVGAITTAGGISISNITDASSYTQGGTFTTAGGMAVAKKLYVGDTLNLDSALNMRSSGAAINIGNFTASNNPAIFFFSSNTGSGFIGDAKIQAYGGTGVANSATIEFNAARYRFASSGIVAVNNTSASVSTSTGALVCAGGVTINKTTDSVSSLNGGGMTIAGGVAIAKKLFVGSSLTVESEYIQFPNLTTLERDALTPTAGVMIFNSTTTQMNYYNGVSWVAI